jgi:aminomethyltransferase
VGAALYSCLLGEDGGILDDLIVYRMGPQSFRLISNASTRDKLRAWISMQSRAYELDVSERGDLALLALQGPEAGRVLREALPAAAPLSSALAPFSSSEADGCFIARTGYTGEDGFEIALPAELAGAVWDRALAAGATACGLGARDTLRLEAGLNLYGSDMDETTTPFECGLAWTVSLLGMRQFIGRAALERQLAAGVARERAGLVLEGPGIMRNKMRVLTVRGEGVITSGSYSPSLGRSIALARVPAGASGWAELDLRGQPRRARIVKPPFVKNGRSRVPD